MTTFRVGVIGAGSIARAHLEAYAANPDVEIIAISDINAARARAVAQEFGASRSYADAHELLAQDDIDGVSVCTWNDSHATWTIAAVEAGKHVLVEKPIARTVAEATAIQDAVRRSDRVVQVGFVRRHSPNCQVLKSFIDAGQLGEMYYAKAGLIRRMGNPGGWFADKEIAGGGPLLDIGIHVLDLAWYLMGCPKAVSVSGNTYEVLGNRANITTMPRYKVSDYDPDKNTVEDMANAVVRFENGASLLLECSYSLHATKDSTAVSVHGTKGGADLEPTLQIATEMHDSVVNITPQISSGTFEMRAGFGNEIANFVGASLGRAESVAPAEHGVEMARILEAVYTSAAEGREIRLD
ncbi:Gfo/Idh/MocA family oxidoreductase [Brachybacterium muris]|uniref:Oxidoreductase n=1 Tax=Brachybacterium muris UCD-AY4 TaxID=1249481 RepID=A0A022KZZ2_9MICO|nr:Gfo/Idh/MocA family oxidoreductase [Brachybacterium muris]EYT48978.1 oxidoreductase [Brachybacterium muris UCD-AY4]MCT1654754.1 Gfo/Idh/MocA family oxidoreductase [Brachybacterium muris]MCT2176383.1 Gfo/Idh/MocA family oxidoreductase [Brachybacterium muris]MCT2260116.1 Gfo/Idh/MocA family oxidoreductase [Brachybacterium muris]MCT2294896.1 Gfo/Idh/MocA family oxidoreductase [Brachybacterium muris]